MNPLRGLRKFWGFGLATIMEPLRGYGFLSTNKEIEKCKFNDH